jgi:hypothetical protein
MSGDDRGPLHEGLGHQPREEIRPSAMQGVRAKVTRPVEASQGMVVAASGLDLDAVGGRAAADLCHALEEEGPHVGL